MNNRIEFLMMYVGMLGCTMLILKRLKDIDESLWNKLELGTRYETFKERRERLESVD